MTRGIQKSKGVIQLKVVVTGGSGKLGRVLIGDLLEHGHSVLNLDRVKLDEKLCPTWVVDLRESGHIFQALSGFHSDTRTPSTADGIIHLAAYPAPDLVPDTETFNNNVTTTYNVLNSAYHAGVKKVVLASSIGAFGLLRPIIDWYPEYIPIDEAHSCKPQDSYGLSKLVGEKIADSFAAKSSMTICSFRLPGFGFDYETFRERWKNPAEGRKRLWTYIDIRDAATACRLGLEAKFKDHEVFAVSAAGTHDYRSTNELIRKYLPMVKDIRNDQSDNWSCVDGSKAERVLHFKPKHRWEEAIQNR